MALSLAGDRVRGRFALSLPLLAGLVVYAALLLPQPDVLSDADTYWHIAVGRWIMAHGTVPYSDIFSHTAAGVPWVNPEWLAEIVFAWLYDAFGWSGVLAIAALAVAAALVIILWVLLRFLDPLYALASTAAAMIALRPHLLARPHVLAMPLLVAWTAGLIFARRDDRAPSLWLLPLMTLWANLHSSFFIGLVLAALLAGEALLNAGSRPQRWRVVRQWGAFGGLALGAALLTPYGLADVLLPFHVEKMEFALATIVEWQSPNFQGIRPLEIWLIVALFGAFSLGLKLAPARAAIVLFLLHLMLQHQRHADLVVLLTPLLVAEPLAPQLARLARGASSGIDRALAAMARPATPAGTALAGFAALAMTALALAHPYERKADAITPKAAVEAALKAEVQGPVLNDYGFGGYLVFTGIPPFIDGRYLYGDRFIERFFNAVRGNSDELPALLAEYHIGWTLLEAKSPGVTLMDHLPGWRRLYADDTAVVHVRASAEAN